jgi:chemotaxis protein MotB
VAIASGLPPVEDAGGESWMMTYLDMMTLLLVVTMAMLALAGKGHERTRQSADLRVPPIFTAKSSPAATAGRAVARAPGARTGHGA